MALRIILMISLLLPGLTMAHHPLDVLLGLLGLQCPGCAGRAQQVVAAFEGVDKVTVDLEHSTMLIQVNDQHSISMTEVKRALVDAGFEPQITVYPAGKH